MSGGELGRRDGERTDGGVRGCRLGVRALLFEDGEVAENGGDIDRGDRDGGEVFPNGGRATELRDPGPGEVLCAGLDESFRESDFDARLGDR
jgi:hypothetical protein